MEGEIGMVDMGWCFLVNRYVMCFVGNSLNV